MKTPSVPWHESPAVLYCLGGVFLALFGWCWVVPLPLAIAGHEGAIESLLTNFAVAGCLISAFTARFRRSEFLFVGASTWSVAFYLASLVLGPIIPQHMVGIALRVGAVSALCFASSAAYMARRSD